METPQIPADARRSLLHQLATGAGILGAVVVYWPLVQTSSVVPSAAAIESGLFRPAPLPPVLPLLVAAWMLWRRRTAWRGGPAESRTSLGSALLVLAAAIALWSHATGTAPLLFASLAALLLAFAAFTRGGEGVWAVAMPALVLLFGLRVPTPLEDEWIWALQRYGAWGATQVLDLLGREPLLSGVVFQVNEQSFHVIDGCSGQRAILILLVVSLVIRELFRDAGPRLWWVVAAAPVVGYLANVGRLVLIALSANPETFAGYETDHTPQGLAVIFVGTAVLYGLAWILDRRAPHSTPGASELESDPAPAARAAVPVTAGFLVLLAASTFVLPRFPAPTAESAQIEIPHEHAGWTSENLLGSDPHFLGVALPGQRFQRRYVKRVRGRDAYVDLLVAVERPGTPQSLRAFSSKLVYGASDLGLRSVAHVHLWELNREMEESMLLLSPSMEATVAQTWRVGWGGLWRESLRAGLALDASPFRKSQPARVFQLKTPLAVPVWPGSSIDDARKVLQAFRQDFRPWLGAR